MGATYEEARQTPISIINRYIEFNDIETAMADQSNQTS